MVGLDELDALRARENQNASKFQVNTVNTGHSLLKDAVAGED